MSLPRPDDARPWPGPHGAPPGTTLVGGAGGTAAHLADLDHAAAVLDAASGRLDDAAKALARLQGLVAAAVPASAAAVPASAGAILTAAAGAGPVAGHATGPAATADVAALRSRTQGGRAGATQAAARLRTVAALYRAADAAAGASLDSLRAAIEGQRVGGNGPLVAVGTMIVSTVVAALDLGTLVLLRGMRWTGGPIGMAVQGIGLLATMPGPVPQPWRERALLLTGPGLLTPDTPRLLVEHLETTVPYLAGMAYQLQPGDQPVLADPVPAGAGVLLGLSGALAAGSGIVPRGLVVAPVLRPPTAQLDVAPRSISDVLGQVRAHTPDAGAAPGTVGIQRLEHPDGTRSWVVAIPGTQVASPVPGSNPWDVTSDLQVTAGAEDDVSATVVAAMEQAGVGAGEPVLLAGHSLGGMVATSLAADPQFGARYEVAAVLTAGSPVGPSELPTGVQALDLVHAQDVVPTLDGRPVADDPQRTTVVRDLAGSPVPGDRVAAWSPAPSHALDTYLRTARQVEGWADPSLAGFDAALRRVLGDGSPVEVLSTTYQGVRLIPSGGSAPPPG